MGQKRTFSDTLSNVCFWGQSGHKTDPPTTTFTPRIAMIRVTKRLSCAMSAYLGVFSGDNASCIIARERRQQEILAGLRSRSSAYALHESALVWRL